MDWLRLMLATIRVYRAMPVWLCLNAQLCA